MANEHKMSTGVFQQVMRTCVPASSYFPRSLYEVLERLKSTPLSGGEECSIGDRERVG